MNLRKTLIDYCNEVIADEKTSCTKHKWACLRFLNDLKRENTPEFPYIFEPKWYTYGPKHPKKGKKYGPAERYFNFMRLFKHSKGPLAGKFKEPAPYELFVYGNVYGWVRAEDGIRRFRRTYEQIARKNAKSQDKAIQAIYETSAFGEPMAEVYVAATKKEQTRHVWAEAWWQIQHSIFANSFTCKFDQDLQQTVIRHKKSGSFFSRLSKDDKKSGDGANPHFTIIDEYHLHETTEYYDLATSGQKTRIQPLLSIITTAGFELSNPCYRVEYDFVSSLLDPDNPMENDRYFAIVCEAEVNNTPDEIEKDGKKIAPGELIDDINDYNTALKANPIIGKTAVGRESIGIELKDAQDKPDKMRDVKTKTLNIWVNERAAGYMNMAKWAACSSDIPSLKGKHCIVGADLSAKIDLTSLSFVFPMPGEEYVVLSHSFMPEDTFREKIKSDKVPYDVWEADGWLTLTPGAATHFSSVVDYALQLSEEKGFKILEWALDPWGSLQITESLTEKHHNPVDIIQGSKTLSEPTKNFRECVYTGKIIHEHSPVLGWAIGNAVVSKIGMNNNIMLNKDKSRQRIDPIAAVINGFVRAMVAPKPKKRKVLIV